jgi:hypothetical protein
VTAPAERVQAARSLSARFRPLRGITNRPNLHGFSGKLVHSTLTALQAEIQFKVKFVKKITNSTNRGRNQLFVRFGRSLVGLLSLPKAGRFGTLA